MTFSNFNDTQNKQVVNTAIDELKLNPLTDAIPRQVIPSIQPVFELKRRVCNISKLGGATNSAATTLYTTPSDKDFYLAGAFLSVIKDATSTSAFSSIRGTVDGQDIADIIAIAGMTLTVQSESTSVTFNPPLKLKRNTTVTVNNSTAVANITAYGSIWGYTEEEGKQYV